MKQAAVLQQLISFATIEINVDANVLRFQHDIVISTTRKNANEPLNVNLQSLLICIFWSEKYFIWREAISIHRIFEEVRKIDVKWRNVVGKIWNF